MCASGLSAAAMEALLEAQRPNCARCPVARVGETRINRWDSFKGISPAYGRLPKMTKPKVPVRVCLPI